MQRSEDAAIHMKSIEFKISDIGKAENAAILYGSDKIQVAPGRPYSAEVCGFLEIFSKAVLADPEAKKYPDIIAFGFFIRRSHIFELAKRHVTSCPQQGRGLVFHIAPSNVPINFAYSFLFGLLSGNSNIVRVSSKRFKQYEIICRIMEQISDNKEFSWVRETNAIICYGHEDQMLTDYLSSVCDTRVIWGGDRTIEQIRRSPLRPRATEITFADRYSLAVFSVDVIQKMSDDELKKLAKGFYNDTYLMDQNACSSPHLICWCMSSSDALFEGHEAEMDVLDSKTADRVIDRFWRAVANEAGKYDLEDMKVSEKYTILCENAIKYDISNIKQYSNVLYTSYLNSLPEDITDLRGKFGLFYNFYLYNMDQITRQLDSKKIQTIATLGIDGKRISDHVINRGIVGVDRIVPVGKTLDIDVFWDGYDVISALSRNIFL